MVSIVAVLALAAARPEISFWSGFAHPQVYVMAANGSGRRALTNLFSAKRGAWSPDGRRLAFSRLLKEGGQPDVWLVRPSGRDAHRLVPGSSPAWSPNGRWVAYDKPGGIWAVHPDGTGRRRIITGKVDSLKWSPDGRRIAYTSWAHRSSEIYVARADGSHARRLTRNAVDDFDPSWSPDGRRILYTHGRENAHAVYVMSRDGTGKRPLTRGGDSWATSWRPRARPP
jgi:TolB protein